MGLVFDVSKPSPRLIAALLVTAVVGIDLRRTASAQSVDIAQELEQNSQVKLPFVRARPWQWFRNSWLDKMDRLDSRWGLRTSVSFTTIRPLEASGPWCFGCMKCWVSFMATRFRSKRDGSSSLPSFRSNV